jgi:hypothetical protein
MSQVVTELVIDADTSGADRFAAAMDSHAARRHRRRHRAGLGRNVVSIRAGRLPAIQEGEDLWSKTKAPKGEGEIPVVGKNHAHTHSDSVFCEVRLIPV